MKTTRFNNIDRTRLAVEQARDLLNALENNGPNHPLDLNGVPIHGVRVLETLKVIEVWEENETHWAIARTL